MRILVRLSPAMDLSKTVCRRPCARTVSDRESITDAAGATSLRRARGPGAAPSMDIDAPVRYAATGSPGGVPLGGNRPMNVQPGGHLDQMLRQTRWHHATLSSMADM